MIEIENMQSTVTDHTLRMVLSLCGCETKDKLLYEGDPYYRVIGSPIEDTGGRGNLGDSGSHCTGAPETTGRPA